MIDALIELRAAQALEEIHEMAMKSAESPKFSLDDLYETYYDSRYGMCQRFKPGCEIRSYALHSYPLSEAVFIPAPQVPYVLIESVLP